MTRTFGCHTIKVIQDQRFDCPDLLLGGTYGCREDIEAEGTLVWYAGRERWT